MDIYAIVLHSFHWLFSVLFNILQDLPAPMEIEDVFGWMKTLLSELGLWDFLGTIIKVGLLITASTWAIKMFRG